MIWSGADLTCYHKIDHELVAISKTDRLDRPTRRLRQSHDNAYQVPHCRIDVRKMSFFPRTVPRLERPATWQSQPGHTYNKPPHLLLSFNLFLTYPDARLPLMHSTHLNHRMIFDTTKKAVNRQKQKHFSTGLKPEPGSPTSYVVVAPFPCSVSRCNCSFFFIGGHVFLYRRTCFFI